MAAGPAAAAPPDDPARARRALPAVIPPAPRRRRRRASAHRFLGRPGPRLLPGARPQRRWRRTLLPAAVVVGFVVSIAAGAVAYFLPAITTTLHATGQSIDNPAAVPPVGVAAATPTADLPGRPFTVLLLGSDNDAKFASDNLLTQSMILLRVVPATRQVTLMSIPRDLYVPLSTGGSAKIDTAYSYGGAQAAVRTVEQDFHVHVDHYVWIGLRGLVGLIDELGGVDVVTTNPVIDDFYPADLAGGSPYDYQRVAVLPGAQHMSGLQAMEYVRSRHGDLREDFGRSERQQQVLLALRAKAGQLSFADLPDIAGSLNGELTTDMGIREVADLLPLAAGLDVKNVQRILLLPPYTSSLQVGGQDALEPDWSLIRPLVAKTFP